MCGLAGYVGPMRAGARTLSQMSAAIAHRGPDDDGLWQADGIGLAHRRLSILDLSLHGHQPMLSSCTRYVIAFNGEIYNYLELRSALEASGDSFASNSDTEVLLAAFRRWGRGCLDRLNGMWAFAIWDRHEQTLFASRDRFGKKPFYYHRHADGLLFASEIKALLASGHVHPAPNPAVIADFAAERISDHTEQTFFNDVIQLPPGHVLTWQSGELAVSAYWKLDSESDPCGADTRPEKLLESLRDATRLRLRADTPVGVLLSGGLDSSAITCLAAAMMDGPLHAFSTIGEQPVEEAAGIAKVIAAYPNVVLHEDRPGLEQFLEDLDACLWHQEEPFADGSMVAHFRLMRRARATGVKVLLTGQGADEVFAGYPGYLNVHVASLVRRGRFGEAAGFVRAMAAHRQPASHSNILGHALPAVVRRALRAGRYRRAVDWLAPGYGEVSAVVRQGYQAEGPDALNQALLDSIRMRTLPGFLHYEDRNSMAHGVETRLPFLDYRLVRQLFAIPGDQKVDGGMTKVLLRRAMRGIVPDSIVDRAAKQGYPAPLASWLRTADAGHQRRWRETVEACPLILALQWSRHYQRFLAGDDGALPAMWRGLVLSMWHDRFIAGAR